MRGTNKINGTSISGIDHLWQSVNDILTTPIGSRVMRRTYGSRLFELLDSPMNQESIIDIYAAVADALTCWEPRFKLKNIHLEKMNGNGHIELLLSGIYLPNGQHITNKVTL